MVTPASADLQVHSCGHVQVVSRRRQDWCMAHLIPKMEAESAGPAVSCCCCSCGPRLSAVAARRSHERWAWLLSAVIMRCKADPDAVCIIRPKDHWHRRCAVNAGLSLQWAPLRACECSASQLCPACSGRSLCAALLASAATWDASGCAAWETQQVLGHVRWALRALSWLERSRSALAEAVRRLQRPPAPVLQGRLG